MSRLPRERRLSVEQLEDRHLMTGIVTITQRTVLAGAWMNNTVGAVQTTELLFTGDGSANGLHLTNSGNNSYIVSSINTGTPGDNGTKFRIGATGPLLDRIPLTGIGNNYVLTVKLLGGDDKFLYDQNVPNVPSNQYINFLDANIDMGFGAKDSVEAIFLRVSRDWKIWGGQSQTPPQIQAPVISLGRGGFNNVGRDFCYWGGNGNDDITLLATNIQRYVLLPPDPTAGAVTAPQYLDRCLPTPNPISTTNPITPTFPPRMNLFGGNDRLSISNSPTGRVTVGNATSTIDSSIFFLDAGAGNDSISSVGMDVNRMVWDLNTGDDTVFFQSTNIRWNSEIEGGAGYDLHTESNTNPRNNFKDANGNFVLDNTPSMPTTPPFTTPARQGTTTNPNGAELRYVNFENGQTRPPGGGGGSGGGGGGTGGRWNFRSSESVVVSTSNSANLGNLIELLPPSGETGNSEPTVSVVNDRLLVAGTTESDLILVTDAGNGRVRVRVGSRILGTFDVGQGIAVDTQAGNDFVYVAPSISVSTIVSGTATADLLIGGLNLLLLDNGTVYSNQTAAEHPQFVLDQNPAAQDMALLQILGLPGETVDIWAILGHPI